MLIIDETLQEEDSDTTRKEGQGKRTDGTKSGGEKGQDGERRKTYSAAVIDGFKRTSMIYVGDSIVRKTDTRLSRGEDVVVCLPGARIEHVTERVEQIMGRGYGGSILVHVGTNNADKEGTPAVVEKYRSLLKKAKQARIGQIILSGILPVVRGDVSPVFSITWLRKRSLCPPVAFFPWTLPARMRSSSSPFRMMWPVKRVCLSLMVLRSWRSCPIR